MKVVHLCGSHVNGGAARACYRIHRALVDVGLASSLRVLDEHSDDPSVICGFPPRLACLAGLIHYRMLLKGHAYRVRGFQSSCQGYESTAYPGTRLLDEPCIQSADLIHLHWIGRRLISIEEIGRIRQPLVWTLHDHWPFCGVEHHVPLADRRYVNGYLPDNRPPGESGPDVSRRAWLRKQRSWKKPMHLVAPSRWMADCARSSALMGSWPTDVIPHPLDLQTWQALSQLDARRVLGLPPEARILLLVAHDAFGNPVKGGDLLIQALHHLQAPGPLQLLVVGEREPSHPPSPPFPIHFLGSLHDTVSLRLAYAAADLLVVPSRQESFCQAATEAHACGRPVAAFATGGLLDVVEDRRTGVLAQPFEPVSLAAAIDWILADTNRWHSLCTQARARAEALWCPQRVASSYLQVYRAALDRGRQG